MKLPYESRPPKAEAYFNFIFKQKANRNPGPLGAFSIQGIPDFLSAWFFGEGYFAAGPSVLEEDGGSENGIKNVIIVLLF